MFDLEDFTYANCNVLRRAPGGELVVKECPNCGDTTGRFYVNYIKGKYNCYKCQFAGRNPVGFIAKVQGISVSEARRVLMSGVSFVRPKRDHIKLFNKQSVPSPGLPTEYIPCFDKRTGKWNGIPSYLKHRHVSKKAIKAFKLGWCPSGEYKDRVIFPIYTDTLVSFQARATWDVGPYDPKYDSPSGAPHSKMLFGYHLAKPGGEIWVVEGPMDVIGCYQADLPAVGLIGKSLSPSQANLILRLQPSAVHFMLDPEAIKDAHRTVANSIVPYLSEVYTVTLPEGDPGDLAPSTLRAAARMGVPFKRTGFIGL